MQEGKGHQHGTGHAMPHQTDPVCGMTVSSAEAAGEFEYGGRKYYFCSDGCRRKFEQNPRQYGAAPLHHHAAGKDSHPMGHEQLYTCPMHPEVKQAGPGPAPSAAWSWSR